MRIAAFTSGGIETASSRLRSFYVFQSNVWKEHEVVFNPKFWSIYKYQCIHLQKQYAPRFVLIAFFARILGIAVIFDIDDQVRKYTHHLAVYVMIFLSSFVTTDTNTRQKYLQKKNNRKSIELIPDTLDIDHAFVDEDDMLHDDKYMESCDEVIVWVGNIDNFNSFKILIENDDRLNNFRVVVITNITDANKIKISHKNYVIKQWSLDWSSELANSNVYMVLNHDDPLDENAIYKSENKMVMAICNLIMPIVSDTPAYSSLAENLNAEFLIFNQNNSVYDAIVAVSKYDRSQRKDFFKKSISFINKHYCRDVIAGRLLSIMNKHI